MTPAITEEIFRQFRDFIYEKCGIFIPDNKKYFLENRVGRRLQERNCKGYEDYLYTLKYDTGKSELDKLYDLITTNETFFFREPQHFDVLRGDLLPRIVAENTKAGRRDIRMWSAACSTGEEPYTMAMVLLEMMETAVMRKDIYASDISESVLKSAQAGVYGSYAVRNIPEEYLKKHFTNSDQHYTLSNTVRSMVKYMRVNLMEERDARTLRGIDVIFCRNVLIYFDEKAKQKAVSLLYDALRPNGYLFIGTSESLHNVTRAFRPVVINKVIVYQKV